MSLEYASPAGHDPDTDSALAAAFEVPMPEERRDVLRSEAGAFLDRLLATRARRKAAYEVAIGEYLAAMAVGNRTLTFGHVSLGDYARERLGINARTAQKQAKLARDLRERPALRDAVWSGEVSPCKARIAMPVARGDAEVSWVERAKTDTARALAAAVKTLTGKAAEEEEEPWELLSIPVPPEARPMVDEAMKVAGEQVGHTAPRWDRLNAIFQEFLGTYGGVEGAEDSDGKFLHWPLPPPDDSVERLEEDLEKETKRWACLEEVQPIVAPHVADETNPWRIDAELRRLVAERNRCDEEFGRVATAFSSLGLWRDAQFASFRQYCKEQLGMGVRTVQQRIALERRLVMLPELREAMRSGRISYEKARLIAWKATDRTVKDWIERAAGKTCISLRREIEGEEEAQMWTRGWLEIPVPRHTVELLAEVCKVARALARKPLTSGECFLWSVYHFLETWKSEGKERNTLRNRVMKRDLGYCQAPGCSRRAAHVHHVEFRSHGGANSMENEIALCAAHHLVAIHEGYMRVTGKAPDRLVWEIGLKPPRPEDLPGEDDPERTACH